MKATYLVFALGIFILFACNKDDDLFKIMPESDLIALEGMDEAYEEALHYNDSLMLCVSEPLNCDSATMYHYDELFHQFDEMFDLHHGNYSHHNEADDHHHDGGANIWHGNMMGHHNEGGHNEDEGGDEHGDEDEHEEYRHNRETFELMMHLRELHDEIHPH
jgi:hypothetical protein